ncbi:MAG: hypothetical protein HS101_09395 [Planctomycetia bacterium]|jgi:hypothetical protein|nr:hypothetical protein [Planctomycetia bacterium]
MPRIDKNEQARLLEAIHAHDFLHRIVRTIEHLHRVVFHAEKLDPMFVRASAEEILSADIYTRHHGQIDGVYFALRKAEDGGRTWAQAIAEYAAYIHNYYTMPLGVVMRRDLFGDACHFVTPAAGKESALNRSAEPSSKATAARS